MENYTFVQLTDSMKMPDTIYNGRYNKEPAIIRIKDGKPAYVQFIENSSIFKPEGILLSNVELLLPSQKV